MENECVLNEGDIIVTETKFRFTGPDTVNLIASPLPYLIFELVFGKIMLGRNVTKLESK
ncbi:hypothetical protein HanIR_Chr09g0439171 [Helianthus annuus]|nr:hypothetical protein HanIR_Chr09g0439171 [Helianthus annuus]